MNLEIKEIQNTIKNTAPFHKKSVEDSFNGRKISWTLKLFSVRQEKNSIYDISAKESNHDFYLIFFKVNINQFPELKNLPQDSIFYVEGTILKIDGSYIRLEIQTISHKQQKTEVPSLQIHNSQIHFGNGDINKDIQNITINGQISNNTVSGEGSSLISIQKNKEQTELQKYKPSNLFKRITNNPTSATIIGTLIVVVILYLLKTKAGINLN